MLLKVGVYLMVFALALTALAVAYTVAFRDEPERAVAEPAAAESSEAPEPLVREYPPPQPEVKHTEQRPAPRKAEPSEVPEPAPRPAPDGEQLQAEGNDWPTPTPEQVAEASGPRRYDLPPGAVMGLTVKALELYDVPV